MRNSEIANAIINKYDHMSYSARENNIYDMQGFVSGRLRRFNLNFCWSSFV
jgi:hypothetical protein